MFIFTLGRYYIVVFVLLFFYLPEGIDVNWMLLAASCSMK